MFNPTTALYMLIGSLGAALIAALFTFFNLVSTKEAKISEFRQKWIDDLRTDIVTYVRQMELLHHYSMTLQRIKTTKSKLSQGSSLTSAEKEEVEKLQQNIKKHLAKAKLAHTFIQLRVNKDERDKEAKVINDEFLTTLNKTFINPSHLESNVYNADLDLILDKASALLKMEWKRVKRGESGYVWSKRIAIIAIIIVFVGLFCLSITLKNEVSPINTQNTKSKITANLPPPKIDSATKVPLINVPQSDDKKKVIKR